MERHAEESLGELRQLQRLARRTGVSFTFPLLFYGTSALVSAALLAGNRISLYNLWWLVVAATAPVLIAYHYHRRLITREVGISWPRAFRYTSLTEIAAAALWFAQPLYPLPISAPWLAFAVGAAVVGRTWAYPPLQLLACAIVAVVALAALATWPMHTTDLIVGALLCAAPASPAKSA